MLQLFKVMRSFLVTLYRVQGVPEDLNTRYRVSQRTFIHGLGCPRENLYTGYSPYRVS